MPNPSIEPIAARWAAPAQLFVMIKNMTFKTIIVIVFALMMPLSISAQDMYGWRVPTKTDLADETGWRKDDKFLYLTANADFDGDGKQDK